jgi:KRAB domain-containing zinc finger protein
LITFRQPIVCVECGIEAQGREGLLNHYRVSHKKLPPGYENHEQFICEQCSDLFITEESLRKHIAKKHTNPTERQCPKCGQEFSGRLYLSQHYKLVHGAVLPSMEDCEKFLCDECPSVFFAKESLASHKRQHHMSLSDPKRTPKKRKQCPHCPKTFAAHQSWLEHIKSKHEMNTPYKCDECTRSYGTKCRLLVHKTSMHKRIKCDICGQEICNSFMLRKHKASVHGVIPKNVFHCEHCPLFFYKVLSKESHVRTHHPDTLVA